MPSALNLLQNYLTQQAARGVTQVRLNPSARQTLSSLRGGKTVVPTTQERPAPRTSAPATAPVVSSEERTLPRAEQLTRVSAEAANSARVRALRTLRDTMVFAVGNPSADLMFIGEAPGEHEELQREPFVGPAGQTLTKIIQAMGLKRSDIYISNICKYRPIVDDGRPQGSRNRPPTPNEMAACLPFIIEEIRIIQPKVIVALGSSASAGLGLEGSVSRLRGQFHPFLKIPVMVTYHPSYLLRREQEDGGGIAEKRMVWEDLLKVMELVGLPISDKQRAYFSKARG